MTIESGVSKDFPLVLTEVLRKEGVENKVLDFDLGKDYMETLGVVLVEGSGETTNRVTGESTPRSVALLLDLEGKKVVGGAIGPWYGKRIEFSLGGGLTCQSEDGLYGVRTALESLITWSLWGVEAGLEPTLNKSKPEVELTEYDRFIRRFVSLVDLYLRLDGIEGIKVLESTYMDRIHSLRLDLQQEIESVLKDYPQEFKDVP